VSQLTFAAGQAAADLAQRVGAPELAERQGHELAPTGEAPRVAFGLVILHGTLKFGAREQLQQLRENAAYSIHG
jgi:hypothetical protein